MYALKLTVALTLCIGLTTRCCQADAIHGDVNICDGVADMIFLPYVHNCSRYYVCLNNTPIARECEHGFMFDAKNQACDYPSNAQCLPTCTAALSSFCYDRTCTKFVLCYAGTPVVRECRDGLQYNADTDRCDFPQYVDCVENMCTIFNDPSNITFLASKAACDKYYVCMSGDAYGLTCSNGLQFNPETNYCDFPENVDCEISLAKRNIVAYSKAPPKRADIECPAEGIHFLPNENAEKYYFCQNGRGVVLECTPGLVFDAYYGTCREPKYVGKGN